MYYTYRNDKLIWRKLRATGLAADILTGPVSRKSLHIVSDDSVNIIYFLFYKLTYSYD